MGEWSGGGPVYWGQRPGAAGSAAKVGSLGGSDAGARGGAGYVDGGTTSGFDGRRDGTDGAGIAEGSGDGERGRGRCIRRAVETARAQATDAADGGDDRSMQVDGDEGDEAGAAAAAATKPGGQTGKKKRKQKGKRKGGKRGGVGRTKPALRDG